MIHLDKNPEEYAKYHEWRLSPDHLTDEYLRLVAEQVPGPVEVKIHAEQIGHDQIASRRAVCCRLCDLDYVAHQVEKRKLDAHSMSMLLVVVGRVG